MMNCLKRCLILLLMGIAVSSCTVIRPYDRVYLNDPKMQMTSHAGRDFSNYVHAIREGSAPAGSATSSGGCGCN